MDITFSSDFYFKAVCRRITNSLTSLYEKHGIFNYNNDIENALPRNIKTEFEYDIVNTKVDGYVSFCKIGIAFNIVNEEVINLVDNYLSSKSVYTCFTPAGNTCNYLNHAIGRELLISQATDNKYHPSIGKNFIFGSVIGVDVINENAMNPLFNIIDDIVKIIDNYISSI